MLRELNKFFTYDQKESNQYIIPISEELVGIKINSLEKIGCQSRLYCFEIAETHNFTIGLNGTIVQNL